MTFTVYVTKCGPEVENSDGSCGSCLPPKEYLYNGECYKSCPSGKITEGKVCYDSCQAIAGQEDYYFNVATLKCIQTCNDYKYEEGKRCYRPCPKKYNNNNLYVDTIAKTCAFLCPENYISNIDNICVLIEASQKCLNSDVEIKCITECPYGTYFSKEKNNCIYDSTINNPDTNICIAGFCQNEGTCSIINNKPVCKCIGNFYGSSCQNKSTAEKPSDTYVKAEFDKIHDTLETIIDFTSPGSISIAVELTTVISKDNSAINKVLDDEIISMSNNLINTLNKIVKAKIPEKNAIPYLSFTIKALIVKLKDKKGLRLLTADPMIALMENNLKDLVDEFLQSTATTELMQGDAAISLSKLIEDDGQSFMSQVYTQDIHSLTEATSQAQKHKISTIDISDIVTKKVLTSYGIVKIDLIPDYQVALTPTGARRTAETTTTKQTLMKFAIVDLITMKIVDIPSVQNGIYLSLFPSAGGNALDMEKYTYFMERGIDITNPDDIVFTEPCYYNWALEYDLPQKYRYNELFPGMTIGSTNENCTYKGFDTVKNSIVLECTSLANVEGVSVITKEKTLPLPVDKDHVDNLPTLCGGSIDAIANNFGFWTYLLVFIIGLIPTIFFGVMCLLSKTKGYIQSWIASDKLAPGYTKTQVKTDEAIMTEEVVYKTTSSTRISQIKSFDELILYNFKTVHPLTTVCRGSVVTPLMLKITILMSNIFNLFGFNALFYNEDMIGKKMEDDNRDNLGYPMKSEFHKIVYSLLITMGLNLIVRAITIVTIGKKEKLSKQLDSAQSMEEKQAVCKSFWMEGLLQRIIVYAFMLILSLFFFYYCVIFCGIYVNTQYGWFYSGLWSLFMDWVVFAPVSILIITGVETISPVCGYYAKQLFWF